MKRLTFDEIAKLKVGRSFHEEDHGQIVRYHVSVAPKVSSDGKYTYVDWAGKTDKEFEISFRATKELMRYGPNIMVTFRKDRKNLDIEARNLYDLSKGE